MNCCIYYLVLNYSFCTTPSIKQVLFFLFIFLLHFFAFFFLYFCSFCMFFLFCYKSQIAKFVCSGLWNIGIVSFTNVFRTLSSICDVAFFENSSQVYSLSIFIKKLHQICLPGIKEKWSNLEQLMKNFKKVLIVMKFLIALISNNSFLCFED